MCEKGIITPYHSIPTVVRSRGGKPGPVMDKRLFLILRIMQERTCHHSSVWRHQYIWHGQWKHKTGNRQHDPEFSAGTLAGIAFPAYLRSGLTWTMRAYHARASKKQSRIHPM